MSRTWKDQPYRVKLMKNMAKGLIDHDHRTLPERSGFSRFRDRELSLVFYKWATKEILAYQQELDARADVRYEMIEHKGVLDWKLLQEEGKVSYSEKTIAFKVYRAYDYSPSEYCTDVENYDPFTRRDKRDGKRARCTPRWTPEIASWKSDLKKNEIGRGKVKEVLQGIRNEINGFESLEGEWEEDYAYSVIERVYGPKVWVWED